VYLARAYPIAYPIDTRVDGFIRECLAIATTNQAAREIIPTLQGDLASQLEQIADRMAAQYVGWQFEVAEAGGFDPTKYQPYQARMLSLLRRQHAIQISTLGVMGGLMPERDADIERLRSVLDSELAGKCNPTGGRGMGWPDPYGNFERSGSNHASR